MNKHSITGDIKNSGLLTDKPFINLVEKTCPKCNGKGHNLPMMMVDIPGNIGQNRNKKRFPLGVCSTCGGKGVIPNNNLNIIM